MSDRIQSSLDGAQPPANLSAPLQALWWLKKGDLQMGPEWRTAHEICQSVDGDKAHDWVHALVHWIEGDQSNANYWYRRVGEQRHGNDIAGEWRYIVERLGG
ncbi:MAG: hypothetical protein AAFX92_14785 [Pseudomonadota bacterium]